MAQLKSDGCLHSGRGNASSQEVMNWAVFGGATGLAVGLRREAEEGDVAGQCLVVALRGQQFSFPGERRFLKT